MLDISWEHLYYNCVGIDDMRCFPVTQFPWPLLLTSKKIKVVLNSNRTHARSVNDFFNGISALQTLAN